MNVFNPKLSAEVRLKVNITKKLQPYIGDPDNQLVMELMDMAKAYAVDILQEQQEQVRLQTLELQAKAFHDNQGENQIS